MIEIFNPQSDSTTFPDFPQLCDFDTKLTPFLFGKSGKMRENR
nr:MAG TPA: hypothetical protein [Caudoviricetes sp.]